MLVCGRRSCRREPKPPSPQDGDQGRALEWFQPINGTAGASTRPNAAQTARYGEREARDGHEGCGRTVLVMRTSAVFLRNGRNVARSGLVGVDASGASPGGTVFAPVNAC